MDLKLAGRIAFVTGGSRGIGRAVARRLLHEGCEVTIVGMDAGRVATTARELAEETGRRVEPFAADLREAAGCLAAAQAHEAAFGHLDVLVNCAGATRSIAFTLDSTAPVLPDASLSADTGIAGDFITQSGAITAPASQRTLQTRHVVRRDGCAAHRRVHGVVT